MRHNHSVANIPSGTTYGKWTVIQFLERRKKRYYYLCKCECGNEVDVNGQSLLDGTSTQCRVCSNKIKAGIRKITLEPGQQFNDWTVISKADPSPNYRGEMYAVRCKCGTISKVSASVLKNGRKQKCCKRCAVENQKGNFKYDLSSDEPSRKLLLIVYENSAKRRGLEFSISYDDFVRITSSNCHYCDVEPMRTTRYSQYVPIKYNGIDRVDNSLGYVNGNCVPCCIVCNRAKQDMTQDEWSNYLHRLTQFQNHGSTS